MISLRILPEPRLVDVNIEPMIDMRDPATREVIQRNYKKTDKNLRNQWIRNVANTIFWRWRLGLLSRILGKCCPRQNFRMHELHCPVTIKKEVVH